MPDDFACGPPLHSESSQTRFPFWPAKKHDTRASDAVDTFAPRSQASVKGLRIAQVIPRAAVIGWSAPRRISIGAIYVVGGGLAPLARVQLGARYRACQGR